MMIKMNKTTAETAMAAVISRLLGPLGFGRLSLVASVLSSSIVEVVSLSVKRSGSVVIVTDVSVKEDDGVGRITDVVESTGDIVEIKVAL